MKISEEPVPQYLIWTGWLFGAAASSLSKMLPLFHNFVLQFFEQDHEMQYLQGAVWIGREKKEKGKRILEVEGSKKVTTEQSLRTQITLTYQLLLITRRVRFATGIIQKTAMQKRRKSSAKS